MSLTSTVKSIQDIMRKDAGVDGDAQRLSQLVWMLFLKIFDDRDQELELMDDAYVSIIPENLQWRNWAADPEGITGDALSEFINNELFPTLKEVNLTGTDPRGHVVKDAFEDAYNYMKKGHLIRQVINKLNELDFKTSRPQETLANFTPRVPSPSSSSIRSTRSSASPFSTPRVARVDSSPAPSSTSVPR
jgi:type I restriction enzyme M protein